MDRTDQSPPQTLPAVDPVDHVIRYHIQTKHHFNRYARSLGYLDWANQPDPFRRFDGAPLIPLPLLNVEEEPLSPAYSALYDPREVPVQPVTLRSLSRFFEYALALSAWKRAGESEWALRSNPSSGNLHPTEGYIFLPLLGNVEPGPGLYHYAPKAHGLEQRAVYPAEAVERLLSPFPRQAFLFGLTSVHWREAWKYGERAFRYCNHDVGHALGSARIAAATLGWSMLLLDGTDHNTIARLLGTNREEFAAVEPEHPDCVAVVWPREIGVESGGEGLQVPMFLESAAVSQAASVASWHGTPNRLSREHGVQWDLIEATANASWKTTNERSSLLLPATTRYSADSNYVPRFSMDAAPPAGQIIRQRRSAVAFDGTTSIEASAFFQMLERVLPRSEQPELERPVPWDLWPYPPAIHLMLFVHRVTGLPPGLYFLLRDPRRLPFLQQSMNQELTWTLAPGCPEGLPLYWLLEGDATRLAMQVSCHQEIAGASAFSFGMLAEFEGPLRERGAWWYPRLFWESGLLGQVLYLEAEAAGVRATGIGCFFDDPVHEIVGVKGLSFQSLYHFTVGGPVEDHRLMTLPPYYHLGRSKP